MEFLMNWVLAILPAIQAMDPVTAVMATVMVIFFGYRGGSNIIPIIKKNKSRKEEKNKPESKSPLMDLHKGCKNYSSLAIILEKVMFKSDKIVRIKYQDTLYEQMNDAELMWEDVTNSLRDNFTKTFDKTNPKAEKADRKYAIKCYAIILESMETGMLGLIRKWMKKNHFIEKSELDYVTYMEEKAELLHTKMKRLFDDRYEEDKLMVKATTLRKAMEENSMPVISKRMVTFFLRAKVIATEKSLLIREISDSISNI